MRTRRDLPHRCRGAAGRCRRRVARRSRGRGERKVLRYAFAARRDQLRPGADQRPLFAHRAPRTSSRRRYATTTWRGPFEARPHTAAAMPEVVGRLPHLDDPHPARHLLRRRPGVQGPAARAGRRRLRLLAQALLRPGEQEPDLHRLRGAKACSASTSCARRRSRQASRSTTTREVEGLRALDRYTLRSSSSPSRARASSTTLADSRSARRGGARGGRGLRRRASPSTRSAPARSGSTQLAAQLAASCSSATRTTASVRYDGRAGRRRRRRPGDRSRRFKGRAPADGRPGRDLDHRGEPAALAGVPQRRARRADDGAAASSPTQAVPERQARAVPRASAASRHATAFANADGTLDLLQHGGSGGRRLHAGEGGAAPGDRPGRRRRRARSRQVRRGQAIPAQSTVRAGRPRLRPELPQRE